MKIGFIGLGIMGKPMAINLAKKGYDLQVYDLNAANVGAVAAAGAAACASVAEACAGADVIITMLPNSPQVEDVVLSPGGVLESARPGALLVDMSSINPMVSISLEQKLAEKGLRMLDAPVSGGEPKAVDGTLSIMCGGRQEDFDQVRELLLCMGASAVLVGKIGSGNTAKLSNQIIVAMNIAAACEAYLLAAKAGVEVEKVFDAIKGGLAGSTVLNAKTGMMMAHDFKPGFRIGLHIKDLTNAMASAGSLGLQLPLSGQVLEMMKTLDAQGHGADDHSGLLRYYEELNQFTI